MTEQTKKLNKQDIKKIEASAQVEEGALSEEALDQVSGGAYQLHRAFIKSWSTSGDADDRPTEEVAFYYNKIG